MSDNIVVFTPKQSPLEAPRALTTSEAAKRTTAFIDDLTSDNSISREDAFDSLLLMTITDLMVTQNFTEEEVLTYVERLMIEMRTIIKQS